MRKKLSCNVRPGVELEIARSFTPASVLMTLDFPTFERPTKAICSLFSSRILSLPTIPFTNFADLIFIVFVCHMRPERKERMTEEFVFVSLAESGTWPGEAALARLLWVDMRPLAASCLDASRFFLYPE